MKFDFRGFIIKIKIALNLNFQGTFPETLVTADYEYAEIFSFDMLTIN